MSQKVFVVIFVIVITTIILTLKDANETNYRVDNFQNAANRFQGRVK